jgi:hypothetical protein
MVSLVERRLVFADERQVAEKLAQIEPGSFLVGFSRRGMIELERVDASTYALEFYDFASGLSHVMRRPLTLSGVPCALKVVLQEARSGSIREYEFAVFKPAISEGEGVR